MSLPAAAVERLFFRLLAVYGVEFANRYAGVGEADVKAAWAHELGGYASNLHPIAWALDNLPQRCPNALEFRALCNRAPQPDALRLDLPKADPARIAAALAKTKDTPWPQPAPEDWWRRIIERSQRGEQVSLYALRMAQEVAARRSPAQPAAISG